MIVKDEERIAKNPLVTVQVFAYNKEAYIRQCLDSIVNQKVNFEFEVLVSENPGTDNTRSICLEFQKNHPDIVILILREKNMGLFYNYFEAERMSRGKYIARCDGDDYWCDDNKLQKQVDFLESHNDYGLCYTPTIILNDETHQFINQVYKNAKDDFKSLLIAETVQQSTAMYRKDLVQKYFEEIKPEEKDWAMEDTPRTLWFAFNSKIARIDEITGVYRVINNSWSHQTDYYKQERYHKSILDIRLFFYNKYCPGESDLLIPLYNDYYSRNIKSAYELKNFKALWNNIIKYKYTSITILIRHALKLLLFPFRYYF